MQTTSSTPTTNASSVESTDYTNRPAFDNVGPVAPPGPGSDGPHLIVALGEYSQRLWKKAPNFVEKPITGDIEQGGCEFEATVMMPDGQMFHGRGKNKKLARCEACSVALFHYLFERAPKHHNEDIIVPGYSSTVHLQMMIDVCSDGTTMLRLVDTKQGPHVQKIVLWQRRL